MTVCCDEARRKRREKREGEKTDGKMVEERGTMTDWGEKEQEMIYYSERRPKRTKEWEDTETGKRELRKL